MALARLVLPSVKTHPGGLGAVRAEARAGGADLRRQRSRSRLDGRRRIAGPPADVGRGRASATSRPPVSRRSSPSTRGRLSLAAAQDALREPLRLGGFVSQYQAAGLRARCPSRSIRRPLRRAGEVRRAAARGTRRSRADSGDRIPARRLRDRARTSRSPPMATSRRSRCSRACRSSECETLALDISSRTSVALTRVLCAKHWEIAPKFTPAEPDLERCCSAPTRRW